jgi:hypothetical protein
MIERQLSELPGYQPLAHRHRVDNYLAEKSAQYGSESAAYAAGVAAAGGGLSLSPAEVERLALKGREGLQRTQGVAPYVAALASRLTAVSSRDTVNTLPLEQTALTTLFRDRYGVDLVPYMEQSTGMLGITRVIHTSDANAVGLNYMAIRKSHGNVFWQLTVDGNYGFVNMHCPRHDFPTMPLRGMGNIAFVPGVEEALFADAVLIEQNPRR